MLGSLPLLTDALHVLDEPVVFQRLLEGLILVILQLGVAKVDRLNVPEHTHELRHERQALDLSKLEVLHVEAEAAFFYQLIL